MFEEVSSLFSKFEGNLTSGWGGMAARPKIHSKIILGENEK
jgi:hypothetical protein